MKIQYKMQNHVCKTPCPNNMKCKTGSTKCQKCEYFVRKYKCTLHNHTTNHVECNYDKYKQNKQNNHQKTPLGIQPKFVWLENRLKQIDDAMYRYSIAGVVCPDSWHKQRVELIRQLSESKPASEYEICTRENTLPGDFVRCVSEAHIPARIVMFMDNNTIFDVVACVPNNISKPDVLNRHVASKLSNYEILINKLKQTKPSV